MTRVEFLKLCDAMTMEELEKFQAKSAGYADRDGGNVLSQFDRLVSFLGVSPAIMLPPHLQKTLTRSGCIIGIGPFRASPVHCREDQRRSCLLGAAPGHDRAGY